MAFLSANLTTMFVYSPRSFYNRDTTVERS